MKRQLFASCALALVCASGPTWAANGNIGLFFDTGAALCQQTIPCEEEATLYVYALLQGASQTGITGAEYKVQIGPNNNLDPNWLFEETFDVDATVVGSGAFTPADPLARGVTVAWPDCQVGDGTKVLIETVLINNRPCTTAELTLKVVKKDNASNQYFQCPLFTLCDGPVYTKVCLGSNLVACANPNPPGALTSTCSTSGEAYVNPGLNRNCTVSVQETTWSAMKGLYRK